ncbi:MAG: PQQ-binding-like beta-propeller repeat protein [Bacteroidota bacterium]|nr:PQQ-binding-like beta-propeller repeat protein [Bacteroidota bacterium]
MKKFIFLVCIAAQYFNGHAQIQPFKFAFISDTHIGSPNGAAEEDLRRTVADINTMHDISFVVITGDITEMGTNRELAMAKQILDSLHIRWYIIPGNHDTGWSESGAVSFTNTFGSDRFLFSYNGIVFMGCASGPYVRMSDGHIPREAVNWMKEKLGSINPRQPLIFLNHYPINNSLDNWYEAIDALKTHNTIAILCGHGHANHAYSFEGIPGIMGRSNLRAKATVGGYNIVAIRTDSILFAERKPGLTTALPWAGIKIEEHHYTTGAYERPSYAVNDSFPNVRQKWTFHSDANVSSTPAVTNDEVIFGNSKGVVQALDLSTGNKRWQYATGAAIYSSPAVQQDKVVIGSADANLYCLDIYSGALQWKFKANAAVLGSPLIYNNTVYIGASDHHFYAIDLLSGAMKWSFPGLNGPVVSTPVVAGHKVIFGAWDTNLYALDTSSGRLVWKWSNGSTIRNLSPASCIPVVKDSLVYVVAPDRFLSAINLQNGKTLWRSNEYTVRESLGSSTDGKYLYCKNMNDSLVCFATGSTQRKALWALACGFGYDHVPSMPATIGSTVFFGTRNGRVYAVNADERQLKWVHKIDNSMINTVRVLDSNHLIVSTMDGVVSLLHCL